MFESDTEVAIVTEVLLLLRVVSSFQKCKSDLKAFCESQIRYDDPQNILSHVEAFFPLMIAAVRECHGMRIIHRDISVRSCIFSSPNFDLLFVANRSRGFFF